MCYMLLWTFILGLHDCNYVICLILQHTCLVCYDSYQHITYLAFIMQYAYYLQQEYNRSYQVIFWVFFNYILYIQHNICSMNMKHCKKEKKSQRDHAFDIKQKQKHCGDQKNKIYSVSSLQNYKKKFKYPSTPTLSSGRTLKFYFFFILFLQVKSASS